MSPSEASRFTNPQNREAQPTHHYTQQLEWLISWLSYTCRHFNTVTTKVLCCNHSCKGNSTTTLYSNVAVSGEFIETYLLMCPQLIYEDTGSPIMILLLFAYKTFDHCFPHKRAIFSTSVPNKFGAEPSPKTS